MHDLNIVLFSLKQMKKNKSNKKIYFELKNFKNNSLLKCWKSYSEGPKQIVKGYWSLVKNIK